MFGRNPKRRVARPTSHSDYRCLTAETIGASFAEYLALLAAIGVVVAVAGRAFVSGLAPAVDALIDSVGMQSPLPANALSLGNRLVRRDVDGRPKTPSAPVSPASTSPPIERREQCFLFVFACSERVDNTKAFKYFEEKLNGRLGRLGSAGEAVGLRRTSLAQDSELDHRAALTIVERRQNELRLAAAHYGLDPALLAGTLASEVDFDYHLYDDALGDALCRQTSICVFAAGPSYASVHLDELKRAKEYLAGRRELPGADAAQSFVVTHQNVLEHPEEAAAIILAWKVDLKRQAGGSVDSPQDMAVLFGTYRAGAENFDLKSNIVNGGPELAEKIRDPAAVAGVNAYQSEPYFEYYSAYYKSVRAGETAPPPKSSLF